MVALKRMTSELIGRLCGAAARRDPRARSAPRRCSATPATSSSRRTPAPSAPCSRRWRTATSCAATVTVRAQQVQREQLDRAARRARGPRRPTPLEPWLRGAYTAAPDDASRLRVVVDQVASLTDTSALAWHARLVRDDDRGTPRDRRRGAAAAARRAATECAARVPAGLRPRAGDRPHRRAATAARSSGCASVFPDAVRRRPPTPGSCAAWRWTRRTRATASAAWCWAPRSMPSTAAGAPLMWANGRVSALGFYERLGWDAVGEEFSYGPADLPHYVIRLEPVGAPPYSVRRRLPPLTLSGHQLRTGGEACPGGFATRTSPRSVSGCRSSRWSATTSHCATPAAAG